MKLEGRLFGNRKGTSWVWEEEQVRVVGGEYDQST
jgi:hypothetical protein